MNDKRIIDMTISELREVIVDAVRKEVSSLSETKTEIVDEYVYGIQGLADLLGCKKSAAQKLSNSGKIDSAKRKKFGKEIPFHKKTILELTR